MSAPTIRIDSDDPVPPFQQILEQLRGAIERGALAAGAALPTVRQLADDLGVAPNTVARAYADLQDGGWLVSEGRRGTRVAVAPPIGDSRARARSLRAAVAEFTSALERRGYSEAEVREAFNRAG